MTASLRSYGSDGDDRAASARTIVAVHPTTGTPWVVVSRCVGWRAAAKRAFDVVAGSLLLVALVPVLIVLAAVTRVTSRGPVLFRQTRVGRHAVPFEMLKFRTMYEDSTQRLAADAALFERYVDNDFKLPVGDDPRITRIGRVLRRSSLDELPQLINVVRGEMSLVGPRPVVERELRNYGPFAGAYTFVRPGITGRWQTEGRNSVRYPQRAVLDAEYVEHYRLRDDIVILLRTLPRVLARDGVH